MCGILAISSSRNTFFQLVRSLESIKHRGPDDGGYFISESGDCHLGHVRLSIIDLSSAGHQPMEDATGRFVISYNGEIYNYLSLKKLLEKTYGPINWWSNTDTEVILEGFSREGLSFLSRLNGIFAIAIYDKENRTLLILRDPLGIKPLYYTEQKGCAFICSEVKGLLKFSGVKKTLRKQSLADVLAFMYVPEPHTMYEEFFKVEPGVYYVFSKGKQIASGSIFNYLSEQISFSSEEDMVDSFREIFSAAVRRQLISEVPVSLFLSGGLDSSAVAHEVIKNGGNVKDAYTITFTDQNSKYDRQSDDLYYAKIIADKLGFKLNIIEVQQDLVSLMPELSYFLEDGLADPAAINTYLISKGARNNGVKVMLSGHGADEFLGGYRRYLAEKMYGNMSPVTKDVLSLIGKLLPQSIFGRFNAHFRRLKKFAITAGLSRNERLLSLYVWNTLAGITGLFQDSSDLTVGQDHANLLKQYKDLDVISAMMLVDQKYDLTSLNLAYTDKMSMMVGVEARVPFLDFEMVRVMNSIPLHMKIKGSTQKYILKKAMEPYLPNEVIYRQKAGFALPIRSWLKNKNEMIEHYFEVSRIHRQDIFNAVALKKMCDEQFSGKYDHSYTLFAMLSLQIWLDLCLYDCS